MYKVLALDGGGIRGVIPAAVLVELERRSGKRIAQMFDLIVGTSTGGIIAAGAVVPDDDGGSKYTANDLLDLYRNHGKEIFSRSFWDGVTSLGGATDQQYPHARLEELLGQYMGETKLSEAIKPVVITTYDIEARKPYFCKTSRAKANAGRDHYLRDVARATSAAPTYFEPKMLRSLDPAQPDRATIDGGVFVNNPAMCAFSEAVSSGETSDNMVIASFGTGTTNRPIPYEQAKDWGALGWVKPVISVMMDGSADAADHHLRDFFPDEKTPAEQRYFRFDKELTVALDDLDAAHSGNILNLQNEADAIIQSQSDEIDRLLALLA